MKTKIMILAQLSMFAIAVLLLSSCSLSSDGDRKTAEALSTTSNMVISSQLWESDYLYDNIPAPTTGTVYEFIDFETEQGQHSTFKVDDFDLDATKAYISVLESQGVVRFMYDVYEKNDYPILNYRGTLKDKRAISISQSGTTAVVGIYVESV